MKLNINALFSEVKSLEGVVSSAENSSNSHFQCESSTINPQLIRLERKVFLQHLLVVKACHTELRCLQSAHFWQQPPKPGNPLSGVLHQVKCCTTHTTSVTALKQYMLGFGLPSCIIINLAVRGRTCPSTSLQIKSGIFREP